VKGAVCAALLVALAAARASAQPPRNEVRLFVTVVDQTRAVIPEATVTVTGLEDATRAATLAPVKTSDQGVATVPGLAAGRYTILAEFPGFEPGILKDVRLRAGDNRHVIVLAIQGLQDSVTVSRDKQEAAADRRDTFGTALTREQVEALSDDPDEMAQQLQDIAGGNAIIRVDSFEGGRLPPKAQIKSIHITRDAFAAENHNAGSLFIDIITQPGIGPMRVGLRYNLRANALVARNPFTPVKGPERTQTYGTNFGGSLIKNRASFSLSLNGTAAFQTPNLNASLPNGTVSTALDVRTPQDVHSVYGNFDYAITKDQTLRVSYSQYGNTQLNLGIGAYDLPERGYSSQQHEHTLRVQEAGPVGRRLFTNTRVEISTSDSGSTSTLEAPTVRVTDSFNSGGAQVSGGRHTRTMNLMSDLDYVRGIHSVRTGIQVQGGHYQTDDSSNYLGTYTFESLDAFNAAQPRSFVRRIGDPSIDYWNFQGAWYIQDDIRVRRGLTFSPGLRYEIQTHLNDANALGPRFGVTWAPFKNGKTSLRASAGIFYDWLSSGTYEQTLRVDGYRQQELNISDPCFPTATSACPPPSGIVPPTNKYLLDPDLQMARYARVSAGVDQTISPKLRVSANYAHTSGRNLQRGLNQNPVVNGVRPDPAFANVIEVVDDAGSSENRLTTQAQVTIVPPSPNPPKQLWNPGRFNFGVTYVLGRLENDSTGPFNPPPTGSLAAEWGPANNDIRNRFSAFMTSQQIRNLTVNMNFNVSSGTPYTITTGLDDNGDLIFNDRPAGVGRNTLRAEGVLSLNANFVYTFLFGRTTTNLPPGIRIDGSGGNFNVQTIQLDPQPRFRLGIVVSAQNLTNHTNYTGYSGTMTSAFFGQPTAAQGMRKIDVGLNFNF
jgi:hypothetical protein